MAQYKSESLAVNFLGVRGEKSAGKLVLRQKSEVGNWFDAFPRAKAVYPTPLARRHNKNLQVRCFYGIAPALGSEPES
ncbi:MAG: hypothetical protein KME26_22340 [Oscillatoria princeps RMCB-10]|nr:hypothetical protein [Oscillatoria princeps RMCB-10]